MRVFQNLEKRFLPSWSLSHLTRVLKIYGPVPLQLQMHQWNMQSPLFRLFLQYVVRAPSVGRYTTLCIRRKVIAWAESWRTIKRFPTRTSTHWPKKICLRFTRWARRYFIAEVILLITTLTDLLICLFILFQILPLLRQAILFVSSAVSRVPPPLSYTSADFFCHGLWFMFSNDKFLGSHKCQLSGRRFFKWLTNKRLVDSVDGWITSS